MLGVFLCFWKELIVVIVDIEFMFYCFLVDKKYRNFFCFFWYKDNDINNELIEYCMWVYVFGNLFLLVVVVYCFCKVVCVKEDDYGCDVVDFVRWNFYVDDGLIFLLIFDEVISLFKRI